MRRHTATVTSPRCRNQRSIRSRSSVRTRSRPHPNPTSRCRHQRPTAYAMNEPRRPPATAANSVPPRGNVPSATRNPAKGRITSLGIGGIPKLSTIMSAKSPGRPTVARMYVTTSTIVPIRETLTAVRPPRSGNGDRSRVRRAVEDQAERLAKARVRPGRDALEIQRILATAAGDGRSTPPERDRERDADFDLAGPPARSRDSVAELRQQLLFLGAGGRDGHLHKRRTRGS